ncbi:MAG: GNAT family N-acetyltransferase [Flavobacteriaceae bacterium]
MPASEVALPLRIGARTIFTLRPRLVRRSLSLAEAQVQRVPVLPPLAPADQGYHVTSLPAAQLDRLLRQQPKMRPFIRQRYARRYARLDQDFEDYLRAFSPKSRSTARRKLRRFAERAGGVIDVRCYREASEIDAFYTAARTVSAKTYQELRLAAGLPGGPDALAEMRALAGADRARGWLLHLDGEAIAYLWAPADGDTLIYAWLGYDPAFADLSPGIVLQLEVMRQLMEERRFLGFDFTEGDGHHKRLFGTGSVDCLDILLLKRSPGALATGYGVAAFDGAVGIAKRLAGMALKSRPRR